MPALTLSQPDASSAISTSTSYLAPDARAVKHPSKGRLWRLAGLHGIPAISSARSVVIPSTQSRGSLKRISTHGASRVIRNVIAVNARSARSR
ncbi:hypothetical protein TWF481_007840 [Arthrobotrys musiformis]|uniref:Uncharacterized protein n=1 Tax=Arthrobotrys musiformis TaxID=47236 RepID=A0AAV9W7I6_9PEZI